MGPAAVLACLPGEQHDLGLIAFGLALHARGWRIVYLGPDAPIETVEEVSRRLEPSLVVVHTVSAERVEPVAPALRELAARRPVALGGAAARDGVPGPEGVLLLTGDPIAEAERITALTREAP
jgi:methanogenic corrinoid protein MtbC1